MRGNSLKVKEKWELKENPFPFIYENVITTD